MKLKSILSAIGALMLGALLIGCQGKKDMHGLTPKEPTNINIWHYYNGAQQIAFEELVSEFNQTVGKELGIVVSEESKGSIADLADAVKASVEQQVGAEDLPNMFQCYLDSAVAFDSAGIFVNLDDYVTADEKAAYVPSYVEEGTFGADNAWKLFPVAKSTEVMMINKTDWEPFAAETGHTTEDLATWEGLAATAEDYYNWSGGKSFFGRDAFANYLIVGSKQLGKDIVAVDGANVTLQFEEDIMKKLWDNYYVPYVKGYYKQVGRYRSDDVKLGEIISLVCSTSSSFYFPHEVTSEEKGTYAIDYEVLPVPNFEGKENYAVQQGASVGVIKSDEKSEYASVVFLKWLTETEQNMDFSVQSGYLPVRSDTGTAEAYRKYMQDSDMKAEGIEKDTILMSLKQTESSQLYTLKGFTGGAQVRNVLESSMIELAVADRAKVDRKIKKGTKREKALAPYLTEDYFMQWYKNTKAQLEELCK